MKYSTRPKNAGDRLPKVKRSPHFNLQKHHRPQQGVNTYHTRNSTSLHSSCAANTGAAYTATGEPVTVIAKVQQPPRPSSASAQPTSYLVVDDQQPGTSRQMIFNPPSVAPSPQEESQHNTSGLSSLFGTIPSVLQYQQMDTPQPFSPSQLQLQHHQCHLPLIMNSQDLPASPASRVSPNQQISPHKSHQNQPFSGPPKSSKNN